MNQTTIPVITLDGISGAGKGTVSLQLAHRLAWHYLDSGVLYRLLALEAEKQSVSLTDEYKLAALAANLHPQLQLQSNLDNALQLDIIWKNEVVTHVLRTEAYGLKASQIARYFPVRTAFLGIQRYFRRTPGLIADGRDMGNVIFPDAIYKFFLTASVEIRTQRRQKQLKQYGNYASLRTIENIIVKRDKSDQARLADTLQAIPDACVIDTTCLSVKQVMAIIEQKLSIIGLHFH